ncbi:hypothetical protein AB3Z07_21275 [Metabacillus halosaccharovorans]|uniref:hypothetical protein n=1 Tax=Metabacillus halosaccharovorans TaxID=930124 RepID=UPI0034CD36D8
MDIKAKEIPVNLGTMMAEIDANDSTVIYIVENGTVQAIPLPEYGVLEIPCQNKKIGNLAYRITLKRK